MSLRFEMHRSANPRQPYYWRIVSEGNNAILCSSETYVAKQSALDAANLVYQQAGKATYTDYTQ